MAGATLPVAGAVVVDDGVLLQAASAMAAAALRLISFQRCIFSFSLFEAAHRRALRWVKANLERVYDLSLPS